MAAYVPCNAVLDKWCKLYCTHQVCSVSHMGASSEYWAGEGRVAGDRMGVEESSLFFSRRFALTG